MAALAGGFQKGDQALLGGQPVTVQGPPARKQLINLSVSIRYNDGRVQDVRVAELQPMRGGPEPSPAPRRHSAGGGYPSPAARGGGGGGYPGPPAARGGPAPQNYGPPSNGHGAQEQPLEQLGDVLYRMTATVDDWRARSGSVNAQEAQHLTAQLEADTHRLQASIKLLATMQPAPASRGLNIFKSVRPADPKKVEVLENFKQRIIDRCGAGGIAFLGRRFRLMDDNHSMDVDAEELRNGLIDIGLRLSPGEVKELIKCVDKDGSGFVNFDEFLLAVRGDINPRREKMIMMAFRVMDRDQSGQITIDDIADVYDVRCDPDVLAGRQSKEDCLRRFLANFDGADTDGIVTKDEFMDYYRNISASIDDDDYFELMIRNAWHISGGEGWCENTSNLRVMVALRDGTQKVVEVKDDLGLDKHNQQAVLAKLKKQGITDVVKFTIADAME